MKSKLSLLVLALLSVTLTQAQGLHFGIKGGANMTKVDGKAMSDEFNYGYQLGGFAEVGLGKMVHSTGVDVDRISDKNGG